MNLDGARRAWWLPGAHLQTTWSRLTRSRRLVTFTREILETPDGDELLIDHAAGAHAGGPADAPRVLLLHGLEGSAHSFHTQGLAHLVTRAGWRAVVMNFRSCARDPADIKRRLRNRRPRLYHSGETTDLALVVRTLAAREPDAPLYAIGFSLGGSVLLKWLGEVGAASAIRAAASISAPYDLAAASRYLERRVGRFYTAHFMRRLRAKALDMVERFPRETAHLDAGRIRAARTFRELDDCVTAPLFGFADAGDYYARASTMDALPRIAVPTLCVSSEDDPLFPAEAVARAREAARANAAVTFTVTPWGGHTGFVGGPWPWRPYYWAEEACLAWLQRHHAARGGADQGPQFSEAAAVVQ